MTRLLLATTNPGKLDEMREALAGTPVELVTLRDLPALPEPDETGATFAENARLKAVYYASRTGIDALGEDSGLAIDALDGAPGVHSARFLSRDATYLERFAEIERRLSARPSAPRTARFVCAVAVASGDTVLFESAATVEGVIAREPSGTHGFGYDPIFIYPPYAATLASVGRTEKLSVSHRGQACREVADWLRRHTRTY
jgi:XTP/dITP diphosphohydrolase